jgi:hypothetical protein
VPLDAAEAGLLDIGLGKDRSGAAHQQQDQAGRVASSCAPNASNRSDDENSWEPLLSVMWRVGVPHSRIGYSAIAAGQGVRKGFSTRTPA